MENRYHTKEEKVYSEAAMNKALDYASLDGFNIGYRDGYNRAIEELTDSTIDAMREIVDKLRR